MIFKDYYKILDIDDYKVPVEKIKQAYHEQAKRYHPDINKTNPSAEERFKDINEAYKVLSNQNSRRKYDRMWYTNIGKKKVSKYEESKRKRGSIFSEFFIMFFGENNLDMNITKKEKKVSIKGENIETEIDISIKEAFYGQEKQISLKTQNGKNKILKVKIPAGIRNQEKIRLVGQGKKGLNGGKNGDLLIKVNIKDDKKYQLNGIDLYTNLYLTPWEAALGAKVELPSIEEVISIQIPQGIQSEEIIKIKQKGYHDGNGGRGDLFVKICITVPKKTTEKEKALYKQLQKISKYNPRDLI